MSVYYELDYYLANWHRGRVCESDNLERLDGPNAIDESTGDFVYIKYFDCGLLRMEPG